MGASVASPTMRSTLFLISALLVASAFAGEVDMFNEDLQGNTQNIDGVLVTVEHKASSCAHAAKAGDKMTMHYTGTIDPKSATGVKGQKFDSSLDRGTPFSFTLGVGQVIQGWDKGLVGICPGEKRNLVIPPEMGYGSSGAGNAIPGGATLDFSVECLHVN